MRSLYERFEKLRASNDLTQMVTTIPEFFKDQIQQIRQNRQIRWIRCVDRLGLCVSNSENPMQRWVQQLVYDNLQTNTFFSIKKKFI